MLTVADGGSIPTDLDEEVSVGSYNGPSDDSDEGETVFEGTLRTYLDENETFGLRLAALGWVEEFQGYMKAEPVGRHLFLTIEGGGGKPEVLDEPILVCIYPDAEVGEGGVETFTGTMREFLTGAEEHAAVMATVGVEKPE